MARLPHGKSDLESPEEHGRGTHPGRGGGAAREEGGFAEGEFGRGPTPYEKRHSGRHAKGQSREAHAGTAGRGGAGFIGKNDSHKGHSQDIEHPQSHQDFETLGGDDGDPTGGKD